MDDEDYKVTSELYEEHDYESKLLKPTFSKENVVSTFKFQTAPVEPTKFDADGDLEVQRRSEVLTQTVEIEHSKSTLLNLVGLQVWRGALLLADWLIYNNESLPEKSVLEVGSGVGLTSIVAGMYRPVVCTDIKDGGILELIKHNVERNTTLLKRPVKVLELNFLQEFSKEIAEELQNVEIILAADVVYDDHITEAFVSVVDKLLRMGPPRTVYVALEKRYVFTLADCDTVAPCYEHFLDCLQNLENCSKEELTLDFPQYFHYERVKELVLWKISSLCENKS